MAQQVFDRLLERVAGLDVHKAQVTAAIRVPDGEGGRLQDVAEFSTTVRGLMALRDWLEAHQVTDLAMEATGVYWRPVWAILEDRFACILVNARDVKQVPGRKTDVGDAAWIAQLLEAGLLRASLVPPKPIRTLRPHAVSQDADRGAPTGGQPAAQDPRGHRHQTGLRRVEHPGHVRARDARRARRRHDRPGGSGRPREGPAAREAASTDRGAGGPP